jgi:hypothetical protein
LIDDPGCEDVGALMARDMSDLATFWGSQKFTIAIEVSMSGWEIQLECGGAAA